MQQKSFEFFFHKENVFQVFLSFSPQAVQRDEGGGGGAAWWQQDSISTSHHSDSEGEVEGEEPARQSRI